MTISVSRVTRTLLRGVTFIFPSSLENAPFLSTLDGEKGARVRARGANEQSPSGKLPSRSYDPTDTRTDRRDHFFFLSSLALCFFSTFSAKLFCGSWSTRLVNDSVTSWRCGAACRRYSLRHILYASVIHVVTQWGNLTVQLSNIETQSSVNITSPTSLSFRLQ